MNIQKQYDVKHKMQRLYVHWDVSTQCQLECSYCYAIKDYGSEWGNIDSWARQKLVIRNIAHSSLPVFLGLLGGEPTIHPRYNELVALCHEAISKHKDGRLYITTNGLNPTRWFEKLKYYDNMYFLWSAHFEYEKKYGQGFQRIIDNIKVVTDKGFRSKINVMLNPDPKTWPKIHKLVDQLEKIEGLEIHPHFLYNEGNVHDLYKYSPEFYEEFKRFEDYPNYLVFEDNGEKTIYNDYTIFNNKKTSFTGWDCYNNNYEIDYKGSVNRFCFDENTDLISNFNFFKNIGKVTAAVCPHSSCNCDGLLKIYKECSNAC